MAVAFGRVLRGAGLPVPLDSIVTFVQCLDAVGITDRKAGFGSLMEHH